MEDKIQPWKAWWPPKNTESLSEEEIARQPWLTWKPDPNRPNDKPWYDWVKTLVYDRDQANIENGGIPVVRSCPTNGEGG